MWKLQSVTELLLVIVSSLVNAQVSTLDFLYIIIEGAADSALEWIMGWLRNLLAVSGFGLSGFGISNTVGLHD